MKYIYSGPPSGVSLNEGDVIREVMLCPGQEVEFAPDNEYALALMAEGHLQEVKPAKRQAGTKDNLSTGGTQ